MKKSKASAPTAADQRFVLFASEGRGRRTATGRFRLQPARHVDPAHHPGLARARQRIHQEHQQQARVDADVVVTDGADGVDVRAVVRADADLLGIRKCSKPGRASCMGEGLELRDSHSPLRAGTPASTSSAAGTARGTPCRGGRPNSAAGTPSP